MVVAHKSPKCWTSLTQEDLPNQCSPLYLGTINIAQHTYAIERRSEFKPEQTRKRKRRKRVSSRTKTVNSISLQTLILISHALKILTEEIQFTNSEILWQLLIYVQNCVLYIETDHLACRQLVQGKM
jgi:hypothetical protein